MACWVFYGQGFNGFWYEELICADSVSFRFAPTNPYTGNEAMDEVMVDGSSLNGGGFRAGTATAFQVAYPIQDQYCPSPRGARAGNCSGCNPQPPQAYDCLNGNCIPSTTYGSPGIYQSLEECQAACGGTGCNPPNICAPPDYCPPGMVCIPSAQWGQIEGLSSDVKNNICG